MFIYDPKQYIRPTRRSRRVLVRAMKPPSDLTLTAISAEVLRARLKHPGNVHLLAALVEEVGELSRALLEGKSWDDIEIEAIQVACVAVRIIEEGEGDFGRMKSRWDDSDEAPGFQDQTFAKVPGRE